MSPWLRMTGLEMALAMLDMVEGSHVDDFSGLCCSNPRMNQHGY